VRLPSRKPTRLPSRPNKKVNQEGRLARISACASACISASYVRLPEDLVEAEVRVPLVGVPTAMSSFNPGEEPTVD